MNSNPEDTKEYLAVGGTKPQVRISEDLVVPGALRWLLSHPHSLVVFAALLAVWDQVRGRDGGGTRWLVNQLRPLTPSWLAAGDGVSVWHNLSASLLLVFATATFLVAAVSGGRASAASVTGSAGTVVAALMALLAAGRGGLSPAEAPVGFAVGVYVAIAGAIGVGLLFTFLRPPDSEPQVDEEHDIALVSGAACLAGTAVGPFLLGWHVWGDTFAAVGYDRGSLIADAPLRALSLSVVGAGFLILAAGLLLARSPIENRSLFFVGGVLSVCTGLILIGPAADRLVAEASISPRQVEPSRDSSADDPVGPTTSERPATTSSEPCFLVQISTFDTQSDAEEGRQRVPSRPDSAVARPSDQVPGWDPGRWVVFVPVDTAGRADELSRSLRSSGYAPVIVEAPGGSPACTG